MSENKSNIDKILRDSLGELKVPPSPSVWKKLSKRLILLELIRLNFTNVSKTWLYAGMAAIVTVGGITYFSLRQQENNLEELEEKQATEIKTEDNQSSIRLPQESIVNISDPEKVDGDDKETIPAEVQKTISETEVLKSALNEKENTASQNTLQTLNQEPETTALSLNSAGVERSILRDDMVLLPIISIPGDIKSIPIEEKARVSEVFDIKSRDTHLSELPEDDEIKSGPPKWKKSGLRWNASLAYTPEFPLTKDEIFVNNNQFSINGGLEYKKFSANIGIGMRIEKTPSDYIMHAPSYDSVGFYYDIDYYEEDPNDPESIIIYYTVESVFDTVVHLSDHNGPDQTRKWIFIPFDIGYEIFSLPKYQLNAKINGNYGWSYNVEEVDVKHEEHVIMEEVTAESKVNYMQIGFGLENAYSLSNNWWLFAEPRVNYYINTPYIVNETTGNGPYSFGLKIGVKYKFGRE
jgi:hypothetical protein